ncbi:DUF4199 domain-containing protein [Roseisolibacter sp. H3M3-2]|uniref:DUF4199 domain-containing protein n=1 Tax=Roseisolibacter sp. H3M3-2 TaxID=3031323 RepID=UPI0023DBE2B7|nr:DUF4199 domain-containing protein [Roseisolibacter sp. H3M3-2]MDF1503278.1 DUF4199 domain-containing protein [Roseisolibacter sp. H3M3-2]
MRTIVLRNGLLAGAIMAAAFAITLPFHDDLGSGWGMAVGYTSMVCAFLLVWTGVRRDRDANGGSVGFGRAFAVGMAIVLVASLVYVIAWDVIYRNWMPDFIERYQAAQLEKARAGGATAAQLAAQRAEMATFAAQYRNPLFRAAITLLEPLPVGLLIALVTAAVHRRRDGGSAPALAGAGATT